MKTLYNEDQLKYIQKELKKWTIIDVTSFVVSFSLFVLFILLSSYEFNLLYKILSAGVLAGFSIIFVYSILNKFIYLTEIQKHILFMLMSEGEFFEGEVISIKEKETSSQNIEAIPLILKVDKKEINLYILNILNNELNIKEGELIKVESKSRFVFSYEGFEGGKNEK